MNPPKMVAISGHRNLTPDDIRRVWAAMKILVANPTIDEIWFGGARGTDDKSLQAALQYRGEAKRPKLVVVVPDKVIHQPRECWEWIHRADTVIELGVPITREDGFRSFQNRNEFMVDHASSLVAFWNGKASGTGNAVRYAKKIGVPVKHIQVHG